MVISYMRLRLGFFREQSAHRFLKLLTAQVLVADHASGVKDVDRRVVTHVPIFNDAPVFAVPPVRPGYLLLCQKVGQRLLLVVGTDAD
jgi:hypothetical protein